MHLRFRFRLLAMLSGLATAVMPVTRAAELQLANGDRITGTVISRTTDKVVFKADLFGTVEIPAAQVRDIISEVAGDPAAAVVAATTPPPAAKPPADTTPQPKPDAPKKSGWDGKVELGFYQYDGSSESTNFDLRASAERKFGDNIIKGTGRMIYLEKDNNITKDNYLANVRWRRELSKRTFAQTLTTYTRDSIKGIRNNWEQNIGAGLRLFNTDTHLVNVGAGLTGQFRQTELDTSDWSTLIELFQDYSYQISKRIKLLQNATAQYSPNGQTTFVSVSNTPKNTTGEANYKLTFNTSLQGKLSDKIFVNLRFEYEFDNAVVKSARADQRIISSIGYGF